MRDGTVRALHVVAAVLAFALVLEGPDLLLLAVAEPTPWLVVGGTSALVTLPLLHRWGVGLVPPWTMPALGGKTPFRRLVIYHLVDGVVVAWLWTAPTRAVVQWLRSARGLPLPPTAAGDLATVAGGAALAALLFLLPALVVFVRISDFRTDVDLSESRASDLLKPPLVAFGSYLFVAWCLVVVSAALGAPVR